MIGTDQIKAAVAAQFNLKPEVFVTSRKYKRLARARQLAMWFCRREGRSFAAIGASFGHRDHSTVRHGCKVIDGLLATDPDWRVHAARVAQRLGLT